ncbi:MULTISPECIES: hypothetical protein [Pantoea]|jgi:hypothetical protein|uniref:hypothetical protein n=1 Tax=Pantoea TaxID=53335 RepID=UPI0011CD944C|nr:MULTISPECIES: hypothetical protein [Pantoea]KAF6684887.1 hypothetical protein HFD94_03970 [Pantoea sp. EKM20T]MDY0900891.1 hypothetical protein [Pantoea agglomerans]
MVTNFLMPPRHNLPHCPARCSKPDYFPDVMIGWPCFAAGGFFRHLLIGNAFKRGEPPLLIVKIFLLFFSAADLHLKQHCSEFPLRWRKKTAITDSSTISATNPLSLGQIAEKNGRRNHADTTEKPDQPAGAG